MSIPGSEPEYVATIRRWLEGRDELLLCYTLPNAAGSGGYTFCGSEDVILDFIASLPAATRIYIFREHALSLRGIVDKEFRGKARSAMPKSGDFLVISMQEIKYSYGYIGYLGDTLEELDEILSDTNGEHVAFGPAPVAADESERLVVYKDGIRAAY